MKKLISNLKPFLTYIKQYKGYLILGIFLTMVWSLGSLLGGYLNGEAAEYLVDNNIKACLITLGIYFCVDCCLAVIGQGNGYMLGKYQLKIARKTSFDVVKKVFKLPTIAFEKYNSGEIINRTNSDTDEIVNTIHQLVNMLSYFVMFIVLFVYIFFNSWIIGLELIAYIIIFTGFIWLFKNKFKRLREDVKKNSDTNLSLQTESIRGIREIRCLGINPWLLTDINENIETLTDLNIKESKLHRIYAMISLFLMTGIEVGVFMTAAWLVYTGKASYSFFIAMTYYVYRCMGIANMVSEFIKSLSTLSVSLERISEIAQNRKYEDIVYGDYNPDTINGEIRFRNVSFKYSEDEEIILHKLSCLFRPNKKIAIVGSSGNGKSTIFSLITRLFDPTTGKVLIDGIDARKYSENALRKHISIVRQEPFFFNKTIKENLMLVKPDATLFEIREACDKAYIDEYIMSLPDGYDTVLGEGGTNLSGGQKQRLSIARALLKGSKIILFDEATSALDNESQSYIKKTINELVKDRTVIIIAHRLSTIIDADKIFVIDKGTVANAGTHKSLMENSEIYRKLYAIEE